MGPLPSKQVEYLFRKTILGLMVIVSSNSYSISAEDKTPGDMKQILGVIAEGYSANRESFDAFQCRFTWRSGTVEDFDAALSGELRDVTDYEGLWLVNKDLIRYELRCNPDILQPALEKVAKDTSSSNNLSGTVQIPCSEQFILSHRHMSARQSKIIKSVTLTAPGEKSAFGVNITPFSLGLMSDDERSGPAYFLREVITGQFKGSFVGPTEERGQSLLHASVGSAENPSQIHYLFDPNRGYLPLHFWGVDSKSGKKQFDAFVLDVKDCGNGLWFPMRGVVFSGDANQPGQKRVKEMRVLDLDLSPPDLEDFYLEVQKGTQVNVFDRHAYFNVTEIEKLPVDHLDEWYQRAVDHLEEIKRTQGMPIPDKAPLTNRTVRWWHICLIGANVLLLLMVAVWFFFKDRIKSFFRKDVD